MIIIDYELKLFEHKNIFQQFSTWHLLFGKKAQSLSKEKTLTFSVLALKKLML